MQIKIHQGNKGKIAEIISGGIVISTVQDALDLMVNEECQDAGEFILYEENISPEFFNLRTGLAGEILQKFVNYHRKLAIVGEFSKYSSSSLKSFITECNRGNQFYFLDSIQSAKEKLLNS